MSDPAPMRLLTWHGAVVCLAGEGGGLVQRTLAHREAYASALAVDPAGLFTEGRPVAHPALGLITLKPAQGGRGVLVARYGRLLSAPKGGDLAGFTGIEPGEAESFLLVSPDDQALLRHILEERWIVRASRRLLDAGEVALLPGWRVRFGRELVDIEPGLSALRPAGTAPDTLPDLLLLPGEAGELVRAEPRSSGLLRTERWPVRARRTAELIALAVRRGLEGAEPEQEIFERDVAFLLDRSGAAGLGELLARVKPDANVAPAASPADMQAAPEDDRRAVLMGWAMREMAPWLRQPADPASARQRYAELNEKTRWAFVFRFEAGTVRLEDKPQMAVPNRVHEDRAQHYLRFFQSVAPGLPADFAATICVGVGDKVTSVETVPVFCFQKESGATTLLLPDIDFLMNDFYEGAAHADTTAYESKIRQAVFAGATTGRLITPDVARDLSTPRLRAAAYFSGREDVDFRLPKIVQCTTPEVEAMLRAQPFCQTAFMPWSDQLRRRFIISIDGNGATCSRVAIALLSDSVLLKYDSHDVLHYFGGLHPWDHYVPVARDSDIAWIMAYEARDPDTFARIAARGRAFAQNYLSRDSAQLYTAMLLQLHATAMSAAPPAPLRPAPKRTQPARPAPTLTTVVAHVQQRGDMNTAEDGWTGLPGSTLAIEGFSIHLGPELAGADLTYQAVLSDGTRSEAARAGEYRGTRGENLPLLGLVIAADGLAVGYEVRFVDGTKIGPVPGGTLCRAESGAAVEAFRLEMKKELLS